MDDEQIEQAQKIGLITSAIFTAICLIIKFAMI